MNILDNPYLIKELLLVDEQDDTILFGLREFYKNISELTGLFKNHPITCGYSESEWQEVYSDIRSMLMSIPEHERRYPYHTGLLREILNKAPITFPE